MATGGVGAQVIINNLSGSSLQCSVGCLAEYGRFLQIGKYDVEESNSIGMSVFLKNTSFYVVSLENVCTESKETKEHLRALLREGVENGAVRPLYRKVLEHQDILQILK
jgi:fatty acid synthase